MEITKQVEIEEGLEVPECELQLCDGSGSYSVQTGREEYEPVFCSCRAGQKSEAADADEYDPAEHPISSMVMGWADEFRATCEENGFIGEAA